MFFCVSFVIFYMYMVMIFTEFTRVFMFYKSKNKSNNTAISVDVEC